MLLALLLHRVAGGNVADLVAQYAGELRLVVEVGHDAAREVDESAGDGEGVHHVAIDEAEGPGQVGAVTAGGHGLTLLVEEGLQFGVVVNAHFGHYLGVVALAHLNLLLLGDEGDLLLARHRVRGAGLDEGERQEESEQRTEA